MDKKPLWAVRLHQPDHAPLFISFHKSKRAAQRSIRKIINARKSAPRFPRQGLEYHIIEL